MYRILLVDDEILVRNAIRDSIDWQAMDCELAAVCENGQKAAQFVQTHPVDIVLTDILMPYMDGMELAHYLHDNHPEIVTVIFSGFGDFDQDIIDAHFRHRDIFHPDAWLWKSLDKSFHN